MLCIHAGPPPAAGLKSEKGAFDLPSILTGVVVVGVLTAGVLASVFGVIPFAQDNGAKQDNSAIRTAEGVAKAKDGRFMDSAGLITAGYLPPATIRAAGSPEDGTGFSRVSSTDTLNYAVATDANGTCYVSVAKSGSGKIYFATSATPEPTELTPASVPGCVPAPSLEAIITGVGGFAPKYIAPAPTGFTSVTSSTSATFSWSTVGTATGYKVEYRMNGGAWTVLTANQPGVNAVVTAAKGDTVDLRVSSVNSAGTSAPSATVTAQLPAGPNFASPISWTKQTTAPAGQWADMAASSDATKILASQSGGLYRSADSGATWTKLTTPAGLTWTKVASSADGTRLMAISSGSNVYISADSGATWTKKLTTAPANGFVTAGSSADGKNLITAGYNALVWVSNDYGNTWTSKNLGSSIMWDNTEVSADGTTMVATSAYVGKLNVSRDGGTTWSVSYSSAIGIGFPTLSRDGKIVLATFSGMPRVSTDYGVTFAPVGTGIAANNSFSRLAVSDDGTKMIISSGSGVGGVYTSTDTGKTWVLNTAPGTSLASVFSSADGAKVVAANTTSLFTGSYPE